MNPLYLVPIAGFLGSLHCAAMCGPFVGFYAVGGKNSGFGGHAAYHLGRLIAYLGLGAVAGLFGRGVLYLGVTLDVQRGVMTALGIGMIAVGLAHYLPYRGRTGSAVRQKLGGLLSELRRERGAKATAGLIGLLSTLLPCGFLYSFAFTAGATGHPLSAMAVMAGFWLGTAPALLGTGVLVTRFSQSMLMRLQAAAPLFLIIFGVTALIGKWWVFPVMGGPAGPLCHG